MSEDHTTHSTHGMADYHHVGKAKQTPFDPNHQVDQKVIQSVWDIIQGKVKPTDEPPLQPGQIEVAVPFDYVDAIAFFVIKELKRRGCTSNFSVKRNPDQPEVEITWIRPGNLAMPGTGDNGFAQSTNCMAAWMAKLDPSHVGMAAVDMFLQRLDEQWQRN